MKSKVKWSEAGKREEEKKKEGALVVSSLDHTLTTSSGSSRWGCYGIQGEACRPSTGQAFGPFEQSFLQPRATLGAEHLAGI